MKRFIIPIFVIGLIFVACGNGDVDDISAIAQVQYDIDNPVQIQDEIYDLAQEQDETDNPVQVQDTDDIAQEHDEIYEPVQEQDETDEPVQEQEEQDDSLTIAEIQHDPMSFTGQITIRGTVENHYRFDFSLSEYDTDFELAIDYRGNQALPEIGSVIRITGQMNYRGCCGVHFISTRFEVVE